MRIYLDTCCYNRPFDDQRQPRIRLEAEAVRAILRMVKLNSLQLVGGDALTFEVSRISDARRRDACDSMMAAVSHRVASSARLERETERLISLGFRAMDATHLASAIHAKCAYFFTVDDVLLRVAARQSSILPCLVTNPAVWLLGRIEVNPQ